MRGREEAHEREHEGRAWLAWHTGYLAQIDPRKVPIKSLIGKKRSTSKPQPDDLNANLRAWGAWLKRSTRKG